MIPAFLASNPRHIAIIGAGHVGLVTAACFTKLGHIVTCLDIDEVRIGELQQRKMPFYEQGLDELVSDALNAGRLVFTTSCKQAVRDAEFVFLAVSTPTTTGGPPDLRNVRAAGEAVAQALGSTRPILVSKSTAPVGISEALSGIGESLNLPVVANPEFLREGTSIKDFLEPDRVVLGSNDLDAARKVGALYEPLGKPIIYMDMKSAEMVKYACNAFLATKISFINEMAEICERLGADVQDVARGMGMDHRIGPHFLNAGIGFGGSCLPKDVKALAYLAAVYGSHPQMLTAVLEINAAQKRRVVGRLRDILGTLRGAKVCLLGLAFKPETDDIRDAPALDLIQLLEYENARVVACDPIAAENARRILPATQFEDDPYEAAKDADAVIVATEWQMFRDLDLARLRAVMHTPVIADGRNALRAEDAKANGFVYFGCGLGTEEVSSLARKVAV